LLAAADLQRGCHSRWLIFVFRRARERPGRVGSPQHTGSHQKIKEGDATSLLSLMKSPLSACGSAGFERFERVKKGKFVRDLRGSFSKTGSGDLKMCRAIIFTPPVIRIKEAVL